MPPLSRELESGGVPDETQVHAGAPHAFTVFGSDRYHEVAEIGSGKAFQVFLRQI